MSIKFVRIKNLTVFDDLTVNLSSGVNVFIGQNGTGKTHLLKAIYGACEASKLATNPHTPRVNLLEFFKSAYAKLNLFHKKNENYSDSIDIYLNTNEDNSIPSLWTGYNMLPVYSDNETDKLLPITGSYHFHTPQNESFNAVFIPVKDMLTHSKGLLSMKEKYMEFPFDRTLTDILVKATQWTLKQTPKIGVALLPKFEKIMEGTVYIENEEFFIKKHNGELINFAVIAEGIKKFGLLWQLIMTENITEGTILLWDEPEANLNPEYFSLIVESLLELSRNNVQIILTTHNYIFAKYFDVRKKENDSVKFHALYKEDDTTQIENANNFEELKNNSINDGFDKLIGEVYDLQVNE